MLEDLVLLSEMFVKFEYRSNISTSVAIVRRAPDGDDRALEHELVALHRELVCTRDEVDAVVARERLRDVSAEQEAGAPRRQAPALDVVWIGP